jgi:hypothetical protein
MSFATITLYVASQRVFVVVSVYFVIDPVRKLLDTHPYSSFALNFAGTSSLWNGLREEACKVTTLKRRIEWVVDVSKVNGS